MTRARRRCAAAVVAALLAPPAPAFAPPAPAFAPSAPAFAAVAPVEPYQPYVVARCLPFVEQPGVREFRDLVVRRVGGASIAIHTCSGYEHGEGRAWDWAMSANRPTQRAAVTRLLDWLLATDAAGNPHAMARRLGIGSIIWNRQVIELWTYDRRKVWEPYQPCTATASASQCHTNHVHVAFSWPGALGRTSWFTTVNRPGSWYPDGVGPPSDGPTAGRLGDFNGDGRPDLAGLDAAGAQLYVHANTSGPGLVRTAPGGAVGPPGWVSISDLMVTDYDGDGHDDILGRQVAGDALYLWRSLSSGLTFRFAAYVGLGTGWNALARLLPPGDFDGDGRPELAGFDASGAQLYVHANRSRPGGPVVGPGAAVGAPGWASVSDYQVADVDGDGRDDIVGRQVASGSLFVWLSTSSANGFGFAPLASFGTGWTGVTLLPLSDLDADGRPEVAGLPPGRAQLSVHRNTSTPGHPGLAPGVAVGGPGWASVSGFLGGDFDRDGRADIVGRQLSSSQLFVWLSTSTRAGFGYAPLVGLGPGWNDLPRLLATGPVP